MIGPFRYVGGKRRLAPQLVALFPPHLTYVEPFAGGAQVFFHKPPSRVEVLNDLNGEIVNFLRICQLHHEELIRHFTFVVASRRLYDLYKKQDPESLTDVQRAVRFLYLQKMSYGGCVCQQTYNRGTSNVAKLPETLIAVAERLKRAQLECRPWERILEKFDGPSTLFYCDPPYVGFKLYRDNFDHAQFEQLRDRLSALRGKFLLSLNDHPLVRRLFSGFNVRKLPVTYRLTGPVTHGHELVIANYPLP